MLINFDFLLPHMHFNDIIKLQFHGVMSYKLSNISWSYMIKVFLHYLFYIIKKNQFYS